MICVVDANIFLQTVDSTSPHHLAAIASANLLCQQGFQLFSFEQTAYEYWTVATRPVANNGLGMTTTQCEFALSILFAQFPLLINHQTVFDEWHKLVTTHSISGKPAHDARYVAGMNTYGITHILTFNVADFARFPGITALDPVAIAASVTP